MEGGRQRETWRETETERDRERPRERERPLSLGSGGMPCLGLHTRTGRAVYQAGTRAGRRGHTGRLQVARKGGGRRRVGGKRRRAAGGRVCTTNGVESTLNNTEAEPSRSTVPPVGVTAVGVVSFSVATACTKWGGGGGGGWNQNRQSVWRRLFACGRCMPT